VYWKRWSYAACIRRVYCYTGGERAAAIYSLIGTATLNGLNPEAYLDYVLERIADHPVKRRRRAATTECRHAASATTRATPRRLTNSTPRVNTVFSGR
jgi:hypothetical protein